MSWLDTGWHFDLAYLAVVAVFVVFKTWRSSRARLTHARRRAARRSVLRVEADAEREREFRSLLRF